MLLFAYTSHLQRNGQKYLKGKRNGAVSGLQVLLRSLYPEHVWPAKYVSTNLFKIEEAGGVDAGIEVIADSPRSGRPRLTTAEDDARAMTVLKQDLSEHRELNDGLPLSCQALASPALAERVGIPHVSSRVWRRRRVELNVKKVTRAKKNKSNFLRPGHRKNRICFATHHLEEEHTVENYWKHVIFFDEKWAYQRREPGLQYESGPEECDDSGDEEPEASDSEDSGYDDKSAEDLCGKVDDKYADQGSDHNGRLNLAGSVWHGGRSELMAWPATEGTISGPVYAEKVMPSILKELKKRRPGKPKLKYVVEDGAKPHCGPQPRAFRKKHARYWRRVVGPAPYRPSGDKWKKDADTKEDWPSRSPDLNGAIEFVWSYIDARLESYYPTLDDLKADCMKYWKQCPQSDIDKIIERIPIMCKTIKRKLGGMTKY